MAPKQLQHNSESKSQTDLVADAKGPPPPSLTPALGTLRQRLFPGHPWAGSLWLYFPVGRMPEEGQGRPFLLVLCWARTSRLVSHLPTAAKWIKGIWDLGVTSQSLLRSRFGPIKLICLSGPTKWKVPPHPVAWPCHKSKSRSAYTDARHLSWKPNTHQS